VLEDWPLVPVVPDVPDCPLDTSPLLDDWPVAPDELLADDELDEPDLFSAWFTMLSMSSRYREALAGEAELDEPLVPLMPDCSELVLDWLDVFDWFDVVDCPEVPVIEPLPVDPLIVPDVPVAPCVPEVCDDVPYCSLPYCDDAEPPWPLAASW
jgi:hypothetical protein